MASSAVYVYCANSPNIIKLLICPKIKSIGVSGSEVILVTSALYWTSCARGDFTVSGQ